MQLGLDGTEEHLSLKGREHWEVVVSKSINLPLWPCKMPKTVRHMQGNISKVGKGTLGALGRSPGIAGLQGYDAILKAALCLA